MKLVNETGQKVAYWISSPSGGPNCGEIDVDGFADHPEYDNQANVYVGFNATGGQQQLTINLPESGTGQQVEMALKAE